MLHRDQPATYAIILTLVGAVVIGSVLWAFSVGPAAWVALGAVVAVVVGTVLVIGARRPRGVISTGGSLGTFDMPQRPSDDAEHRVLMVTDRPVSPADVASLPTVGPESRVFVVAPAVSSRMARWTGDEQAYSEAEGRLHDTIEVLATAGIGSTGHVGAHDPLQATDDGLREFPADEVVYVVGVGAEAQWLEDGVVEAARARYPIPVSAIDGTGVRIQR